MGALGFRVAPPFSESRRVLWGNPWEKWDVHGDFIGFRVEGVPFKIETELCWETPISRI